MRLLYEAALWVEGNPPDRTPSSIEQPAMGIEDVTNTSAVNAHLRRSSSPSLSCGAVHNARDVGLSDQVFSEQDAADTLLLLASMAVEFVDLDEGAQQIFTSAVADKVNTEATAGDEARIPPSSTCVDKITGVPDIETPSNTLEGIPRTPSPLPCFSKNAPAVSPPCPADERLSRGLASAGMLDHSNYSPVCPSCTALPKKLYTIVDNSCIHANSAEAPPSTQQDQEATPEAKSTDYADSAGMPQHESLEIHDAQIDLLSDKAETSVAESRSPGHYERKIPTYRSAYSQSADSSSNTDNMQSAAPGNDPPSSDSAKALYSPSIGSNQFMEPDEEEQFILPPPLQPSTPTRSSNELIVRKQAPLWQAMESPEMHGFGRLLDDGLSTRTLNVAMRSRRSRSIRDLSKQELQKQTEQKYGASSRSGFVTSAADFQAQVVPIPGGDTHRGAVNENINPSLLDFQGSKNEAADFDRLCGYPRGWSASRDRRSKSLPMSLSNHRAQSSDTGRKVIMKTPTKTPIKRKSSSYKSAKSLLKHTEHFWR
jgi:hypothetical protein